MQNSTEKNIADYIKIYQQDVAKVVQDCLDEMDGTFKEEAEFFVIPSEKYLRSFSKTFRKHRRKLKDVVYGDDEHGLLNPTKLAAVLCHTIIDCKPIGFKNLKNILSISSYDKEPVWLANNILINYKIAVLSSLRLIYEQLLAEYKPTTDSEILQIGRLADYDKYDKTSVQTNLIINLARNTLLGKEFDELNYALMMFQWQQYAIKQFNLSK